MGNPLRGPDAQGRYRYRDYTIKWVYGGPCTGDLEFCHDSYDGAPDSNDNRFGWAQSFSDCMDAIDEIEDDAEYEAYQAKCNQPGYWA